MRDKLTWHAPAAIDAGQPARHGFVHIACFLHWLAGRGWLERGIFRAADRASIADGTIELDDLIALTDEQLAAEMATTEGAGFGEACYDRYLERWTEAFADRDTYAVPWTAETRDRAVTILDVLYATWQAEGGLKPAHEAQFAYHDHPEVEHLVPDRLGDQALKVESLSEARFGLGSGHPLLAHADASGIAVACASHRMHRTSSDSIEIQVVVLPGLRATAIASALHDGPTIDVAAAARATVDGVVVGIGRFGDRWVVWWYRDQRLAQVLARSKKRALALVGPTDALMTREATVVPQPTADEPTPDLQAMIGDYLLHDDPALEALLPPGDGPASIATSHRFDAATMAGMLGIAHPGGSMAWIMLASGGMAHIFHLPGVDRALLADAVGRVPEVPSAPTRTEREIGGRAVAWFTSHSAIGAVWVRGDLLCCVGGHVTERTILAAIEAMP